MAIEHLDAHVVAGQIRRDSVGVGRSRGAPWEDCEYLLDRLCEWLEVPDFQADDEDIGFALILAKAALAHLYLAWIHPFGDGNGRTARLIEFLILARSGKVPLPAAHLLSNHYNLTRDRYYRELDRASSTGGDITGFLSYAVEGFVDGIRSHIDAVREHQLHVAWVNYVHAVIAQFPTGKACDRQRTLVLALPADRSAVSRNDLTELSAPVARLYAQAGPRTLSRDLNRLLDVGLLERVARNEYRAAIGKLEAFLPPIADPPSQ